MVDSCICSPHCSLTLRAGAVLTSFAMPAFLPAMRHPRCLRRAGTPWTAETARVGGMRGRHHASSSGQRIFHGGYVHFRAGEGSLSADLLLTARQMAAWLALPVRRTRTAYCACLCAVCSYGGIFRLRHQPSSGRTSATQSSSCPRLIAPLPAEYPSLPFLLWRRPCLRRDAAEPGGKLRGWQAGGAGEECLRYSQRKSGSVPSCVASLFSWPGGKRKRLGGRAQAWRAAWRRGGFLLSVPLSLSTPPSTLL